MKNNIAILFLGMMVTLLLGCGGGGKKAASKPGAGGAPKSSGSGAAPATNGGGETGGGEEAGGATEPYPADKGVAAVSGTVKFDGPAPKVRTLDTSADEKCHAMHKDAPLKSETVVVGANGELANVVVSVSKGVSKYTFEASKDAVELDQEGCHYVPHIVAVMAGQPLKFKNNDPTLHNIHGTPEINEEFNISQATKGQENEKTFSSAEVFKVKCDVHPWMGCHIAVFEHPFFAVSGADGKFAFAQKLVPGKYTLTAWHEKYGTQESEIEVKDDGTFGTVESTFKK